MPSILKAALPVLLLAVAPLALAAQEAGNALPRVIQVVGEGRATSVPDMARVSLGVAHQAQTAREAMDAMSQGAGAILGRLGTEGIAQNDIQTGQLMLEPAYDYNTPDGTPKMIGFTATQMLDVTVRDLGKLGEVLDAVVTDGANRVNGVSFDLSDPEAAADEARRDAVADARDRADLYAQAAGVGLGEIVSISEASVYAPPMPMYDARGVAGGAAASVPVAPGSLSVTASVTVTFAIAD
ncbi:SIMPL domain-containing protein [Rubellimicrobium arenae]|uniref:SIMPL domain-containing protein n=1 Tax=Rubellimicrobium arenae TaxID=2817372 RepID=UPI001B308B7B|nr:SIMPL domain-containing protein [Rubellimicrobium arenae]